jgi:hypothetical protein
MTRKSHQAMSVLAKKWYVSFVPEGRQVKRTAKTFETESEAKAFALKVLARGLALTAGTLNPHLRSEQSPGLTRRFGRSLNERCASACSTPL